VSPVCRTRDPGRRAHCHRARGRAVAGLRQVRAVGCAPSVHRGASRRTQRLQNGCEPAENRGSKPN
jgi:hypothetical protein